MSRARSVADLGNQTVLDVNAGDGTLKVGAGVTLENTGEAQFSGIVTAPSIDTRSLIGNVSIGGVLTYEDVTSVDSIGIVTAGGGVRVPANSSIVATTNHSIVTVGDDNLRNGIQVTTAAGIGSTEGYIDASARFVSHADSGEFYLSDSADSGGTGRFNATPTGTHVGGSYYDAGDSHVFLGVSGTSHLLGNTGIGTTNPTGRLEVAGTIVQSVIEYPTIRPTLDLNFAATKTLDRRITFTRNSVGTFTDELGIVKYASNNVPRFDHDPVTGESLGLLIEESRTNNNKVTNLAVDGMTTANGWNISYMQTPQHYTTVTSPDGLNNSTLLAPNTQDISHYVYVNWPGDVLTGIRTVSCWFKNLSTTIYYPQLRIMGAGSGVAYANFTLSGNGTISSGGSDITGATITPYPNGWYRCTLSWNTTTTHYGGGIVISNSMSSELPAYVGDADDTKGFLAWGFQDEAGSFATSLIPTNGSAVTRGADIAGIKGTNFTDFYNQTEGTIFSNLVPLSDSVGNNSGTGSVYWSINANGGFGDGIYLSNATGSTYAEMSCYVSSSSQLSGVDSSTISNGVDVKLAHAFKQNDFIGATNGTLTSADTSGNLATNVRLVIGNSAWGGTDIMSNTLNAANAHVKRFSYYPKRLPNAQLQGLTV